MAFNSNAYSSYSDIAAGRKPGTSMQATSAAYDAYKGVAGGLTAKPPAPVALSAWGSQPGQTWQNGKMFQQTFDSNGMGNGGQFLDDSGNVSGNFQIEAPKSAAVQALGGTSSPAPSVQTLSDLFAGRQKQYDALVDRVNNRANPYDQTYTQNRLAQANQGVQRQYANAERQTMEGQAARGMLGSGQSEGALNVLNAERANSYSSAAQAALDDSYNRRAGFEDNRTNQLMQLSNGDFSGLQSAAIQSLMLPGQLDSQKLAIAQQQSGLSTTEIQNRLLQYEASDAQWDRENPFAAFMRDLASGAVKGVSNGVGQGVARAIGG